MRGQTSRENICREKIWGARQQRKQASSAVIIKTKGSQHWIRVLMKAGGCVLRKRLRLSRTGKQQMRKQSADTEHAVFANQQGDCVTLRNRWRDTQRERVEWSNGEMEGGSEGGSVRRREAGRDEGREVGGKHGGRGAVRVRTIGRARASKSESERERFIEHKRC